MGEFSLLIWNCPITLIATQRKGRIIPYSLTFWICTFTHLKPLIKAPIKEPAFVLIVGQSYKSRKLLPQVSILQHSKQNASVPDMWPFFNTCCYKRQDPFSVFALVQYLMPCSNTVNHVSLFPNKPQTKQTSHVSTVSSCGRM